MTNKQHFFKKMLENFKDCNQREKVLRLQESKQHLENQ